MIRLALIAATCLALVFPPISLPLALVIVASLLFGPIRHQPNRPCQE